MRLKTILFLLVSSVLLLNCSKKITPTTVSPVASSLEIQEIDFKYLQGKGRINYKDAKGERDVKTTVRIHKDSVIWISFSVIGVQGGRVLINKDSITIVNTLDKEYFVFTYEELTKRFNFKMDYPVIQSALLGNLVEPRTATDKIKRESSFDLLEQTQSSVTIKNYINTASSKVEKVELLESTTNNTVSIAYSNFQPLADKTFPYNGIINVLYKTPSGLVINNGIMFEYSRIDVINDELKFPFTIPRKYERR
jgi:hypothetical protein